MLNSGFFEDINDFQGFEPLVYIYDRVLVFDVEIVSLQQRNTKHIYL